MLTSLLSAYIAINLNSTNQDFTITLNPRNNQVRLASNNISTIFSNQQEPLKNPRQITPIINSQGSIAIDRKTGAILYEKNAHKKMPMASITKLMTALVIIEDNQLDELVTISQNSASTQGSTMNLLPGEQITVENLLFGLLINSGNDAAIALAEHNATSVENFVKKMNSRAKELGLNNTSFGNPTGLDHKNNYSSAFDIAKLGNFLYNNKLIQKAAQITSTSVSSADNRITHTLQTTNNLIGNYPGIKGLKTGRTEQAGQCLIAIATNEQGHEIVTVLLNSPSRFQETKILSDWVFRSFNW